METQTVTIEVAPQVASILLKLRQIAEAQGKTLDSLLMELIEDKGAHESVSIEMTPAERARAFEEWASNHDPNTPVILNDSREAIYGDECR